MNVRIVILLLEMLRMVVSFMDPVYMTRCMNMDNKVINMLRLRGAVVSKYNGCSIEHLKNNLLRESRSSIPDSSKIEEISQILRRQRDFRWDIDGIIWDVIYPVEDNISIEWMIRRVNKEEFYQGIPEKIRESIENSFEPEESNIRGLLIRRVEMNYKNDMRWKGINLKMLKIWTREWTKRNRQMCIGRFMMYMIGIAGSIFDNKDGNIDMIKKIKVMMYGVYSNPVLKNFYHIPYKKQRRRIRYSITDNNIIYADDEMIVLENSWLRNEDDDIYALPVMICIKKK